MKIVSRSGGFDLYALVESDGEAVKTDEYAVTFTTSDGYWRIRPRVGRQLPIRHK